MVSAMVGSSINRSTSPARLTDPTYLAFRFVGLRI
jgi:hypothetical protein